MLVLQHGSFGGPGLSSDEYYTAGSDDFRAYVWKVPDVEELREKRRVVQKTAWVERDTERSVEKTIGELCTKWADIMNFC